ncbi:MAG TPA: cupredoxin domain-containing protein [Candidatus Limnocylindria bacterium]|nr:cupredoxin domain-containing protein [Candidatus Limnocylindria bacterium]
MPIVIRTILALTLLAAVHARAEAPAAPSADVALTLVSVEIEGSKFWLPGTVVAKQGQTVRLTLINKVASDPAEHGFAIPAFGIAEVVSRGETKTVSFTADKAGVFPMVCQLHPAHVGGQLVVLP